MHVVWVLFVVGIINGQASVATRDFPIKAVCSAVAADIAKRSEIKIAICVPKVVL